MGLKEIVLGRYECSENFLAWFAELSLGLQGTTEGITTGNIAISKGEMG